MPNCLIQYNHKEREKKTLAKGQAKEQKMKKEMQEMGKIFPSEIILRGERYFPEEYFNSSCPARNIFTGETVDLEDLFIDGTHAEGRWFYGAIYEGKTEKWNEHKKWEEVISFEPDYEDGGVETIVARRCSDLDNPIYYFLS